ncbi:MAG: helix-turn-helix domain-containing protein [Clostridia bacterium]|nr:helix-turn-helix domain-containing protein [Clostridia bacterium]
MEYREILVESGNEKLHIFMQVGLSARQNTISPLHKHFYSEVQAVVEGEASFLVEDQLLSLGQDEMILIPAETYHKRHSLSKNARLISFQVRKSAEDCGVFPLFKGLAAELLRESRALEESGKSNRLPALLSLVCAPLTEGEDPTIPICDRAYLIAEFFANRYNLDITLGDLAASLSLSEKQTERLLRHHTGNTFRGELTRYRMEAARRLMQNEELTLTEIAEKVGYHSYSGFWKAFNKEKNR